MRASETTVSHRQNKADDVRPGAEVDHENQQQEGYQREPHQPAGDRLRAQSVGEVIDGAGREADDGRDEHAGREFDRAGLPASQCSCRDQ